MPIVNMREAKSHLSRLVASLERRRRGNHHRPQRQAGGPAGPIASPAKAGKRLDLLAGQYVTVSQEDFDADNEEIARLFET